MDQDTLRFLLREAVRETVTEVLQTVLELDRTAFLQAHGGRRNGYYPRRLETTFGQVDLKVPRDREGQYYPAFLKPYARRLVDVGEVAVALYAAGVSQRKAAEVMSFLLGHRYSHETISAMTEEVLQAVEAFRRRPLPEEMAFVYLDGLYLKLLREGEGVVREVVYVALGVTPSGERQVLGYWLLPAESALGWEGVLGELWQRGLRRVLLFITDGLPGLPEAIRRVYPQAEWQRCVVHGVRWSLGQVRARDRTLLAEDLRRVYGAESRGEALEALEALREAWGARYPGVVALWAGDRKAMREGAKILSAQSRTPSHPLLPVEGLQPPHQAAQELVGHGHQGLLRPLPPPYQRLVIRPEFPVPPPPHHRPHVEVPPQDPRTPPGKPGPPDRGSRLPVDRMRARVCSGRLGLPPDPRGQVGQHRRHHP
jgi:putative transposase